jgi:CHAD domain-containing protein
VRQTLERELKLEAPDGFALPDLGGDPLEPRVFTSVYHDTADRSLARAGITLRRRMERGRSVWQLKIPVNGARVELEEPGGPVGPPEPLRALLRAHERRASLAPVAELRTHRHGALVNCDGDTAEVTIDEVTIMDSHRVDGRFIEVEIELKDGEPSVLVRIAKELEKAGARKSDGTPNVFRVLDLTRPRKKAKTAFDALRVRLAEQLDEILAHDPGTRLGQDPESLHDMRVAVRRSRALLRTGKRLIATDTQMLSLELKWLGGVLGDVRDLDVLLEHLHLSADKLEEGDRAAANRLLRGLERQRSRARRTMLKALDGDRYANLLDRFESALAELEPATSTASLDQLASRQLKRLRHAVDDAGDDPGDETLHDLRKHGKRARYAHELAGRTKVVDAARRLQDVLGEHQDAVVATERLRALSQEAPADQALAAGLLIAREGARKDAARRAWREAWQPLAK